MFRFQPNIRESVLYGLLAASCGVNAQAITPTPTQTGSAAPSQSSVTAVSECHMHGSALYCMAGTAEYHVDTTITATQDVPPAITGCHSHETETYCIMPNGDEVEIHAEGGDEGTDEGADGATDEAAGGGEESPSGDHCHFHAGVEHCVSSDASEASEPRCERVQRDYNVRLRVGLLFVILVTSSIGVFGPILVASWVSPRHAAFTILRQFGTGVIISTAFVHLLTHAQLMFQNECLGELAYESTAAAILMAGIFLSFLVEYAGNRLIQWHEAKARSVSVETAAQVAAPKTDMVNITVLEAGIIFHSLLIGLTLVVAGDSFFLTLFAVIVFHQMFEGIALGTRIAALGRPCPPSTSAHGGHHGHAHGHEHYHPQEPTPAVGETQPKVPPTDDTHSSSSNDAVPSIPGLMRKKILLAAAFALVTPLGMAIGIGVLHQFNGNDPSTVIAIGTLDAFSAGILVWVGVVEMWAHDWMLGGEMTRASPLRTGLGLTALVAGMALMSLLGKWA
ncbi:putative metal ion transmembrane transporter protein [Achaetomium macrosporum]|uniref:Metal ion transmembrane transporter protein n=1 Tax=Achaetomium macrosporum TaxID=79813 RepID=A0AAN7C4A8_9PEZI|nr:putative metal ion transmembrane transporter protein [Achaetomium macrosporum]